MFFPFCYGSHSPSFKDYQQFKLKHLKAVRDSLETRLAATNAAIETIERQMAESGGSEAA